MSPRHLLAVTLTCLLLAQLLRAASPGVAEKVPGQGLSGDRYGDPLPDEAVARLGTVRFRHGGFVNSLTFTPDGRFLVSCGSDGARVWDTASGKEVYRLGSDLPNPREAASLSPDGNRVAIGCGSPDVGGAVYEIATGRPLYRFGRRSQGGSACFSPDGKLLAVFSSVGRAIDLCDAATGVSLRSLEGHPYPPFAGSPWTVSAVAFVPGGKELVSAGGDGTIRVWDVATGKERRQITAGSDGVSKMAVSPDGSLVASIAFRKRKVGTATAWGHENRVRLWNVASGKEVRQLLIPTTERDEFHPIEPRSLAFTPDGKALLTGGADGVLRMWDPTTGKELRRFSDHRGWLMAVAVAPGGKVVAVVEGRTIRVRDLATGRDLVPTGGHRGGVVAVAVSADARTVASADWNRTIFLWDTATGQEGRPLPGHSGFHVALALSASARTLFSTGEDRTLRMWDLAAGKERRRFQGNDAGTKALALAPDEKTLAAAGPGQAVVLRDAGTGREIRRLQGQGEQFAALAFSADGRTLHAWGPRQHLHRWDLATGQHLQMPCADLAERTWAVAFAPDRRLVAFGGWDSTIRLVDLTTGKEVRRFDKLPDLPIPAVRCLAFSPDGRTLAWGCSEDPTVWLGEVATGRERHHFNGHQGGVISLAFSADGRFLVSGSEDTTALVWDLTGRVEGDGGRTAPLAEGALASCWERLGDPDAARAYPALRQLTAHQARSISWLGRCLRPVGAVEGRRLARLVADLDSKSFAVREKAMHELAGLGESVLSGLQEARKGNLSLEARRRMARIAEEMPLRILQTQRAVEVLEHIGTPEAKQLLLQLAGGEPGAHLTREAQESLERLARRVGSRP